MKINEVLVLDEIRTNIAKREDRLEIELLARAIRNTVTQCGDAGRLAIALVGAELAVEE